MYNVINIRNISLNANFIANGAVSLCDGLTPSRLWLQIWKSFFCSSTVARLTRLTVGRLRDCVQPGFECVVSRCGMVVCSVWSWKISQTGDEFGRLLRLLSLLLRQSISTPWQSSALLNAWLNYDMRRTDGVDVSRPLLDDEDGSRIVLRVGVRLFTVDVGWHDPFVDDVCAGCCCEDGLDVVRSIDADALAA